MDLETKIYVSEPLMNLHESYLKPNMNIDETSFGVPSSNQGFLQDFNHIDQFNVNGSQFFNTNSGFQTQNFDPFVCYDVHEFKPNFVENNGCGGGSSGHAYVMDNFLYGGGYGLNNLQKNSQLEMMVANQSYLPFSPQETKPLNFVVPDEVSCISPAVNYYKGVSMNRNNRTYLSTKKTSKVRKNLKSNIIKGQWTTEEDGLLTQLVGKYGLRKWSHIAKILPGRIGKQCRERWHNHLRPDIKKEIWSEEEDKILIQSHKEIGNKWAEIAKRLPGRTENSIKNHWNATKRRQYSKRKCRSKYPRGTLLQEYIKSLNLDKNPPIDYRKRSSARANLMKNKTSTSKVAVQQQQQQQQLLQPAQSKTAANQYFSNDQCLVPNNYDFNEVSDFCFDENLFQEGCCSIDSLLDDMDNCEKNNFGGKMQCGPTIMEGMLCDNVINVDENHNETEMSLEIMASMLGVEVKKELDLVEMVSQVNELIR